MPITTRSEARCFGGTQGFYTHASSSTGTDMKFGVFMPPNKQKPPVVYFLAGLECTEETFAIKAGAQRVAAELGLALVTMDTSPRGANLPGDSDSWDFGVGAGFYVDATQDPWAKHYRMYSYVVDELPQVIENNFPVATDRRSIFGHSMGGHGALVIALRNPQRYRSVSALAPIANPSAVPWGEKAFGNYLGAERAAWAAYDASELMKKAPFPDTILVDQGLVDAFLEKQLHPEALEATGQQLELRRHAGYGHGYWFIQSFVADHLAWHAKRIG